MTFVNISAYKFMQLNNLLTLKARLMELAMSLDIKGTITLASEGINLALAGSRSAIDDFYKNITCDDRFLDLSYKESFSAIRPFRRLRIKIKPEIITMGCQNIKPELNPVAYLAPLDLKQWLDNDRQITLLDTRNDYETKIGTFQGAIHFSMEQFTEFPDRLTNHCGDLDKTKPLVMFCTGGIRCEKAGFIARQCGFSKVYQLEGGVLNYFATCGGTHWQGDCFVFDDRVAVNTDLAPSVKGYCPNCGTVLPEYGHLPPYQRLKVCHHCHDTKKAY